MTSVWKRLQRVGKNASKFQFTASYQSLTVECSRKAKWQPNKLSVVWSRRRRRKVAKPQSWQPGISNPFRGVIVWPEPEDVDITVTLYKDPRPECHFEDKEWTFVIEDVSGGRRKPIAVGAINMADYASVEFQTFDVSLTLKISSKKVVSATLELQLSCILLKEGKATDADMQSIASMMSLNEIDCMEGFDEDEFERCMGPGRKLSHSNLFGGRYRADSGSDSSSLTGSPSVKNKRKHKRSKSDAHKYLFTGESGRRLSTGSDISVDKDSDKEVTKHTSAAETKLLEWCRKCTEGYPGVKIKNMTTSWRNGLALCALLHHFEPSLIDFKSLDPRNVQENNKMVFEEFDRLGIPRLLDPTALALTSKPDKLSVMTYLFQIRTYFTTPKAPSLLNLRVGSMSYLPAIREVRARAEQLSPSFKRPDGYNPFSCDEEEDPPPPLKTSTPESKSQKSKTDKCGNSFEEEEDMPSSARTDSKIMKDTSVSSAVIGKHSDNSGKSSAVSVNSSVSAKKCYNPFEDDEEEGMEIADASNAEKSSVGNPPEGYNPFDDDDDEEEKEEEKEENESRKPDISVSSKEKSTYGYNPFDDDEDENIVDETAKSAKRKDSYSAYNPFDDDEEEELESQPKPSRNEGKLSSNETAYNPFDDESDDEQDVDSTGSVKPPPKPPRIGLYKVDEGGKFRVRSTGSVKGKVGVDYVETGAKNDDSKVKTAYKTKNHVLVSNSPTEGARGKVQEKEQEISSEDSSSDSGPKTELRSDGGSKESRLVEGETSKSEKSTSDSTENNVEGKIAEYEEGSPSTTEDSKATISEPAVQAGKEVSDPSEKGSPWVMRRLESSIDSLKRRRSKPDGSSSPSRSRPSSVTRPPPLIPTYQEWKAAGPGAGKESPESTRKDDIKVVARRVLMEARKKAGASDLLPRERVEATEKLDKPTGNSDTVSGTTTNETADETEDGASQVFDSNKAGEENKSTENTLEEGQENRKQERTQKVIKETIGKDERNHLSPKKRQAPAPPARSPPPPPVVSPESSKTTVGSRPANRKLLEAKPRAGARQGPQKKRQAPAPPSRTPPPPPASTREPQPIRSKSAERYAGPKASNKAAKSTIQGNRKFEHRPLKVKLAKDKERTQSPPLSPRDKSQNERNDLLTSKVTRESDDSEKIRRFKELLKEGQGEKTENGKEDNSIERAPELPPKMNKNNSFGERDSANRGKDDATPSPLSSPHKKKLGHAAAAQAYAETRKMDFKNIHPVRHRRDTESGDLEDSTDSGTTVSLSSSPTAVTQTNSTAPTPEGAEDTQGEETSETHEGNDQEFQDTTEYVKQEILNLEEEQRALDKVAGKLESELRNAMKSKGCEDEEERLLQEWFILVNKKNELVRRQTELSMLEKVDELERKHEMINRELRLLMAKEEWEKTEEDKQQERRLIDELVGVVNMRDQLVQVEDSQIQQLEKDEKHVQSILDTRNVSKDDKSEQCCIQ